MLQESERRCVRSAPLNAVQHRLLPSVRMTLIRRSGLVSWVCAKIQKVHQAFVRNVGLAWDREIQRRIRAAQREGSVDLLEILTNFHWSEGDS